MSKLLEMRWSNAFSYGPNNVFNFNKSPLVQLVGKNGHGKSSIALVLEEVLYNQNSKGIKKAGILNRKVQERFYTIELDFIGVDNKFYTIKTKRGATQSVTLLCEGEDISAHTSTATYKLIQDKFGIGHKAFTQIVSQSNPFSLEFLTATDTNRKKFLVDLLNLHKYTELGEIFKQKQKDLQRDIAVVNDKISTRQTWLSKYATTDLSTKPLVDVPEEDRGLEAEIASVSATLLTLADTNKRIVNNNAKIKALNNIDISSAVLVKEPDSNLIEELTSSINILNSKVASLNKTISGIGPILKTCPACNQPIDSSHKEHMRNEAKKELNLIAPDLALKKQTLFALKSDLDKYNQAKLLISQWEMYNLSIDKSLPTEPISELEFKTKLESLRKLREANLAAISTARKKNADIEAHNAKVKVISTQLEETRVELGELHGDLLEYKKLDSILSILVKTFSPSGLLTYKLEASVKTLEEEVNKYLAIFSDGRFQLTFKASSSDKLDVIITDNGVDIDIGALSNGELARVNVSTLLAIRKLMQSLSSTKVNLLVLDETVESLDIDGKDKLIEVLLEEQDLNIILVSHGFTHPLLEKVYVTKKRGISRIEE